MSKDVNCHITTSVEIVKGYEHLGEFINSLSSNQRVVSHSIDPNSQWHYIVYETIEPKVAGMTLGDILDSLEYSTIVTIAERSKKTYAQLDSHILEWTYGVEGSKQLEAITHLLGCKVFNLIAKNRGELYVSVLS